MNEITQKNLEKVTLLAALKLRKDEKYAHLTDKEIGQEAKRIVLEMCREVAALATSHNS